MKIQVKDLGAIKEATIDLSKNLIVFCGPNGTGKTYLAYSIYGLLNSKIHVGNEKQLVKNLLENGKVSYQIDFKVINQYRNKLIEILKNDFESLFGIGQEMAKSFFGTSEISFLETEIEYMNRIVQSELRTNISIKKVDIELIKIADSDILELEIMNKTLVTNHIDDLYIYLYSNLLSFLAIYPISSTYILPVERNSIFTFSKELSLRKQEAIDRLHATSGNVQGLLFKSTTRYPLPIKDGLIIAEDLAEIKKNTSEYADFASEIENELLHGKIQISADGELQFKPDKSPKRILPIHISASIIKTLSSLVIYLKHLAQKNDLIIIDEPEINLHPDNQIILTRLFARMVSKGFRLLISTHSDYITREFNNLIMLSSEKNEVKELAQKLGYKDDEFVDRQVFAAYYFDYSNKRNKQLVVEPLVISTNGFEIPSVDNTIEMQNNIADELFYALEYAGENE